MCRRNTSSPRPTVPHPEFQYNGCELNHAYQDEDMDRHLQVLLEGTNAVYLQWKDSPSPAIVHLTIPELAKQINSDDCKSFITTLSQHFTKTMRDDIWKRTKSQSKCSLWHKQRIGVLTSSTLHLAAQYSRNASDNYISNMIMGNSTFNGNQATEYGQKCESVVRKLYHQEMRTIHTSLKVRKSGLFICEKIPF